MIQNFALWNAWIDKSGKTVTFYATSAGFQRINKGTQEMVAEMLTDIGCRTSQIAGWTVHSFATDYLSDDLDTDDWRDRWNASFEVKVRLMTPTRWSHSDRYLVDSMASDHSWDGGEPIPDSCLVVVDFKDEFQRRRFETGAGATAAHANVQRSPAHDRQSLVSIPADQAFFERGAGVALAVEKLAHSLGGTTHWRDRRR